MNAIKGFTRAGLLALIALAAASDLSAEDVAKKFRLSIAIGGYNPQDEIRSNASNTFTVVDQLQQVQDQYLDPRDDSSAFGTLEVQAGVLSTVAAQYAVTPIFIIEGSIGYQKTDVGNVELSAQPTGQQNVIEEFNFNFSTFRVKAGELERIPLQLTALARLRPRARFNPYLGAGLGYVVQGFEISPEFDELSINMDRSVGIQTRVTPSFTGGNPSSSTLANLPGTPQDLQGAVVDVRDTFEWHLVAGAEFSVRRRTSAFLDLRWVDASRDLAIGFNNSDSLGIPVAEFTQVDTGVDPIFGAMRITSGGLVDTGGLASVPNEDAPAGTDCASVPRLCHTQHVSAPGASANFAVDPCPGGVCPPGVEDDWLTDPDFARYPDTDPGIGDGTFDTGVYYVDGGKVSYDGFSLQLGIRFTF